jgi:hypothetical protein
VRPRPASALILAVALALAVACNGSPRPPSGDPGTVVPASPDVRPTCRAPGTGLRGYVLVRTREIRFADHVGVRSEFRDPRGRRIFLLLGIPGEVGEGLPVVDPEVDLADGSVGRLLGRDRIWILAWAGEQPCDDMAVVGNELSRGSFERALRGAHILP